MKEGITKKRTRKTSKKSQVDVKTALLKKALGYDVEEVVEEYVEDSEGEIKLTKKKVTKKNVPPDVTALKMLMENQEESALETLTDEQLEAEKQRLLALFYKQQNKNKEK